MLGQLPFFARVSETASGLKLKAANRCESDTFCNGKLGRAILPAHGRVMGSVAAQSHRCQCGFTACDNENKEERQVGNANLLHHEPPTGRRRWHAQCAPCDL